MAAHDPQHRHLDTSAEPATAAPGPASATRGAPSVRDLLASCAAAHTVSTPPAPPRTAGAPAAKPSPARPADAA